MSFFIVIKTMWKCWQRLKADTSDPFFADVRISSGFNLQKNTLQQLTKLFMLPQRHFAIERHFGCSHLYQMKLQLSSRLNLFLVLFNLGSFSFSYLSNHFWNTFCDFLTVWPDLAKFLRFHQFLNSLWQHMWDF